mgnify:FL=1
MNYDKAYVIGSKEISKKRLDKFFKRNILKDKEIKVWPAINGMNVDIKKYQELNYLSDNFKINKPGSLGCLLSHLTLWNHCFLDNSCDIALILEDDVILNKNFDDLLSRIDTSALPSNWTILRLSYKGLVGKKISNDIVKPDCVKKKGVNAGSWCYLLNSCNAEILLNSITPYENKNSMDVILRNNINDINMYFTNSKLARHPEKKYSPRKDFNNTKKSFWKNVKIKLRKYLYH